MSNNRKVPNEIPYISVGPNDVILGRGNHLSNAGNEKFLDVVRSRSTEYWSCSDNVDKDNIARQVAHAVKSLGGRFLRSNANNVRISNSRNKGATNTTNSSVEQWEIASNHTVLTKVKQSFRDLTASAKKRTATSKTNKTPSGLSSLPMDQHSDEAKLSIALSPVNSNENSALSMSTLESLQNANTSTSQLSLMVQVDSSNLQQTFRDHSSSEKQSTESISNCKSKAVASMNRNDQGMLLLSAPQYNHDSLTVNELTSQSWSFNRDNKRLDTAVSHQIPNDSLLERANVSQYDLMHRNIVDQQMLAVMREQQSRFPKALQLGSTTNSGTTVTDHMNTGRNYNIDMAQSLIRPELQQQQLPVHRSVLLQQHFNLDAFRQTQLQTYPNQPYQVSLLPTVPSMEPRQSSSSFDALLSQLSPLELANIHYTLIANQLAPSMYDSSRITSGLVVPTDTYTHLSNFHANGGNTGNITSADVLRDLQQAHLRNNDATLDATPKPDSNADSNEYQKPPGRL